MYATTAWGFASNQLATRCVVPFVQAPNGATRASSKPPVCLSKQGDIPGAYWAALTHPATTQEIITRIFAGVHMLSHVVGTANRADIRRLQQLEADNAALSAKGERQQRQLHEGFVERDRTIRQLNELLSTRASERSERPSDHERCTDDDGFLTKRLVQETAA
jgi:hypothetical protein